MSLLIDIKKKKKIITWNSRYTSHFSLTSFGFYFPFTFRKTDPQRKNNPTHFNLTSWPFHLQLFPSHSDIAQLKNSVHKTSNHWRDGLAMTLISYDRYLKKKKKEKKKAIANQKLVCTKKTSVFSQWSKGIRGYGCVINKDLSYT